MLPTSAITKATSPYSEGRLEHDSVCLPVQNVLVVGRYGWALYAAENAFVITTAPRAAPQAGGHARRGCHDNGTLFFGHSTGAGHPSGYTTQAGHL